MKKSASLFFVFVYFITACNAPAQQVIASPVPTVTLSLKPTATPQPTATPALSPEVQAKFDEAGIVTSEMTNATIEDDGLHITIGDKEIVANDEALNNFVYQENGVTKEIYQFLPIVDKETNNMVLYTYNLETKAWEVSEVLEPVKISVDKNKPSSCTYKDVLSGNLARSIRKNSTIVFPEDAVNMGWDYKKGEVGTAPIYLVEGSENVMQLVNYCKMPADFLGLSGTIDVATVAVLNPDNSIGFLNILLGDDIDILQEIYFKSIDDGGFTTGIARRQQTGGMKQAESLLLIIKAQAEHDAMINTIQITDQIDDNLSKFIFTPAKR